MMTITKLNIFLKKQKYVFKTILKTAFKTCYNEVKSPRLKISDPPPKKKYFPISHTARDWLVYARAGVYLTCAS